VPPGEGGRIGKALGRERLEGRRRVDGGLVHGDVSSGGLNRSRLDLVGVVEGVGP
jgi:hypothetical protein